MDDNDRNDVLGFNCSILVEREIANQPSRVFDCHSFGIDRSIDRGSTSRLILRRETVFRFAFRLGATLVRRGDRAPRLATEPVP